MTTLLNPYFGEFGGMYVPQILMPALRQLEEAFVSAQKDPEFQAQFNDLLKNYAGRPTALTKCQNITAGTNTTLYLKREDLLNNLLSTARNTQTIYSSYFKLHVLRLRSFTPVTYYCKLLEFTRLPPSCNTKSIE